MTFSVEPTLCMRACTRSSQMNESTTYKRTSLMDTSLFSYPRTQAAFSSPLSHPPLPNVWRSFCAHTRPRRLYPHTRRNDRQVQQNPIGQWWPGLWMGPDLGEVLRCRGWGNRDIRYRCLCCPLRGLLPLDQSDRDEQFRRLKSGIGANRGI